ncbi:hypothetical protein QEG73_03725 [Chitinophagaceae bacterium 26-R-25]|nr:hypothetical protein [Chitinophagaceae bacterium 26-R-25]
MSIIRPRLNDFFGIPFRQEDVDFVIPFIDEDIPFYIDPFLLWKSPSQQDNSLHLSLVNSFNYLGLQYLKGDSSSATNLINCSECNEIGLGTSKSKTGKKIGETTANEILSLFKNIPQISKSGFLHLEEIQLFINNIGEDRISDLTANFIKSFLIDYTIDQCEKVTIPIEKIDISYFDSKMNKIIDEKVFLPINPNTKSPILFVPKRWIRRTTFISYDNYYKEYYSPQILKEGEKPDRVKILNYNRHNYDMVQTYVKIKERQQSDCKNDPLFKQLPVLSSKRKLDTILKLPTGKTDNADKEYENNLCPLLASMLYPHLDFAQEQSRTDSGVSIRDLIFYNNSSEEFLKEIYTTYSCKQIIFELKNVRELDNNHVDQVNRYLNDSFGKFAIIFTRFAPPKKVMKNLIDLWSGQRKCILILTDEDLKQMCQVYESKNRAPLDVVKKKYIEFNRLLPS